uniref:Uncharacterized protein n=1 Tax=Anguilla anguilla TaxID=7936 RepID=A0A0E9SHX8_ANGAN
MSCRSPLMKPCNQVFRHSTTKPPRNINK